MNAALELIKQVVVTRPDFDNSNLHDPKRWSSDNSALLVRYFHDLALILPLEEITATTDDDISRWVMCQYELEIIHRDRARLPHGGGL